MPTIDIDRIYIDVEILTSVNPPRNYENPDSLNEIAGYIHNELARLDCKVKFQPYQVQGIEYKNVIASFGDGPGKRVIVGVHYDVYGDYPGYANRDFYVINHIKICFFLSLFFYFCRL